MSEVFNIKKELDNDDEAIPSTSGTIEQYCCAKIEPPEETSSDSSQYDEYFTNENIELVNVMPKIEIKNDSRDAHAAAAMKIKGTGSGHTSEWDVKVERPEEYLFTTCTQQSNETSMEFSQDDEYITSESKELFNVEPKVEITNDPYDSSSPATSDMKETAGSEIISNRWLGTKGFHSCIIRICPLCRVEYSNTWSWRRHLGNVHQLLTRENLNLEYISSDRAKCNECGHVIKSARFAAFLEHALTHMPGRDYFKCKFCGWCTFTQTSIASHLLKDHAAEVKKHIGSTQCPYCLEDYANTTKMRLHMQHTHKRLIAEKIVFICPFCDSKFSNNVMFRQHLAAKHSESSADVYNFKQVAAAEENDAGKPSYQCELCSVTLRDDYRILNKMQMHALIHSEKHRYNCKYCGEMFFQLISIQSHICEELREAQLLNTATSKSVLARKKYERIPKRLRMSMKNMHHVCAMCGREFSCESKCTRHRNAHHNMKKPKFLNFTKIEKKTKYQCTICKEFTTGLELDAMYAHAALHMSHQRFKCKICSNSFDEKHQALEHECCSPDEIDTFGGAQCTPLPLSPMIFYVCYACKREFEDTHTWQQHLDDAHQWHELSVLRLKRGRGNVLKCLDCDKAVYDTAAARRAHRLSHLAHKHYKCTRCGETVGTEREAHNHDVQCTNYYEGADTETDETDTKDYSSTNRTLLIESFGDDSTFDLNAIDVQKYMNMICTLCNDMEFNSKNQLMSHLRNVHDCFKDSYTLHKDGSCICNVCNKYFAELNRSFMTRHQLIHMQRPCFICKQCDVKVNTFVAIQSHIVKAHIAVIVNDGPAGNDTKEDPLEVTSSDVFRSSCVRMAVCNEKSVVFNQFREYISYACAECNESLPTQELWHLHMNSNHNFLDENHINIKLTTEGVKRCLECNVKIAGGILHEQRHKFTHMPYRSFVCTMCQHRSNTLGVLIQHLRRRHFTPGKYHCPLCNEVLKMDVLRHEHVRKEHAHAELPKTTCTVCLHSFPDARKLKVHSDIHNPNRKVYGCDECNRTYFSTNEIQRHKRRAHLKKAQTETNKAESKSTKVAASSKSKARTAGKSERPKRSRVQHKAEAVEYDEPETELISVIKIEEPDYEELSLCNEDK